jgi:hypothetical protein
MIRDWLLFVSLYDYIDGKSLNFILDMFVVKL